MKEIELMVFNCKSDVLYLLCKFLDIYDLNYYVRCIGDSLNNFFNIKL